MCPSLIEIGSKTAEKTLHKQTNKQTDRQTNRHYENNGHLAVNQKTQKVKPKQTHKKPNLNINQHSTSRNAHVCGHHCVQVPYTT